LLLQISQVINVYFANFMELLRNIDDVRDESADYKIEELVFACIAMFIFKQGSRHHFNQLIKKKKFKRNFKQIFKLRLPHMDTVDVVLRQLDSRILEEIKVSLLKKMIKKKNTGQVSPFRHVSSHRCGCHWSASFQRAALPNVFSQDPVEREIQGKLGGT